VLFFVLERNFRDKFPHIIQNDILSGGMKIGVEGTIHEANVDLVLYDIELLLVPLWSDLTKLVRNFSLAESKDSLILEQSTERHFNESLICSNIQYQVVVVELAFEELVSGLVIEERSV
jgi:hypothetical protein